jgi:hypothetical protein
LVGVAVKFTVVPVQIVVADAEMLTLTGLLGFTVITILFDVTGFSTVQVRSEVKLQVTISPWTRAALVYVVLLEPTLAPFSFHWYTGVAPPLVGVAVKVTLVPAQMVVAEAAMLTEGVAFAVTVIVMALEVAGLPVAQPSLEVSTQVTI